MGLLEKRIAKLVGNGAKAGGITKPATLIKVTKGVRAADRTAAGTNPTEALYRARGFVKSTARDKIGGTLVETNDRVIVLFGALIARGQIPTTSDKITIEGTTSRIIGVERDPASATYTCLTRGG